MSCGRYAVALAVVAVGRIGNFIAFITNVVLAHVAASATRPIRILYPTFTVKEYAILAIFGLSTVSPFLRRLRILISLIGMMLSRLEVAFH